MLDYEAAKTAMGRLSREFSGKTRDRNEAQTRFEVINRILEDALGWERDAVQVEDREDGGIADYVLGRGIRRAVVEAKREGRTFELPAGIPVPLTSLRVLREDADTASAIDQALGYAQSRGIPIAAVCNGHQLVAFLASRQDGVSPKEGRALVFLSLDDMTTHFRNLWDALSPPGAERLALARTLGGEAKELPPETLADRLVEYPGYKNRNPIAAEFEILGGLFIEDLVRQEELEERFLDRCYLEHGALSQYALVSKEILRKRYAALEKSSSVSAEPAVTKSGIADDLVTDSLSAALSRRPIILVGSVGVGKSVFIRRFITKHLAEASPGAISLYVDYGAEPALSRDLNRYTERELVRQLRENHGIDIESSGFLRSVYRSELFRFREGPYGYLEQEDPAQFKLKEAEFLAGKLEDVDSHLRASLDHLQKAQRRQTVVFLDNVDQRPAEFQESVFLIAQSMASSWPVTCFVSLRPDTFHMSKQSGTLTAYQPRVFTIHPPRVDRVIARRLEFALELLDETGSLPTFPKGLTIESDRLRGYIQMLIQAFKFNEDIIEFVDNMSGGNVRRALDFIVSFVGSGHVDTKKILHILDTKGRYTLPLHEFIRAVIFDDYRYFDPAESPIANVFHIESLDSREHFLIPILVRTCERLGVSGQEAGYVPISDLYSQAQSYGFSPTQVRDALQACFAKRLLDRLPEQAPVDGVNQVRVTSAGVYTCKRLVELFVYVDPMIVVTPILDPDVRARLSSDDTIGGRLARCDVFREYLDEQWTELSDVESPFDWSSHSLALRDNIRDIERRVERARD